MYTVIECPLTTTAVSFAASASTAASAVSPSPPVPASSVASSSYNNRVGLSNL